MTNRRVRERLDLPVVDWWHVLGAAIVMVVCTVAWGGVAYVVADWLHPACTYRGLPMPQATCDAARGAWIDHQDIGREP